MSKQLFQKSFLVDYGKMIGNGGDVPDPYIKFWAELLTF